MPTISHPTMRTLQVSEARTDIKGVLDSADIGRTIGITRRERTSAVVDAERLRHALSVLIPSRARIVHENDGVSVIVDGLGVAADGDTLAEALDDTAAALREYAEDWVDHLRNAPNHSENWGLVQLIGLSSDEQLVDWLTGRR